MKVVLELIKAVEREPNQATSLLRAFSKKHSFPMVDGDTATFFFWDEKGTHSLHLIHWVFGLESRIPFQRIAGTQAFFLSLELPHTGRIEYKLEVQRDYNTFWVRDPRNSLHAFDPFGSNSVCVMGGYVNPGFCNEDPSVPSRELERFTIESAVFGGTREIEVYLPAEYQEYKKYPLIICHDGADYLKYTNMKATLDNLIDRHEVRPLIVAFINGHARNQEYGANPKQPQHVVEEVLPALRARYSISENRDRIGIMGASFGAVASLFTAWTYPDVFGRVLLQSGSFLFTDVGSHDRGPLWDPVAAFVNEFRTDPSRIDAKIYMSCGTFESLIYYNRSLVPLLRKSGLNVRFVESQDGHNWIAWRDRLREGLTTLFQGHLWMYYE